MMVLERLGHRWVSAGGWTGRRESGDGDFVGSGGAAAGSICRKFPTYQTGPKTRGVPVGLRRDEDVGGGTTAPAPPPHPLMTQLANAGGAPAVGSLGS